MKLEINHRRKIGKCTNIWKLNTTPGQSKGQRRNQEGNEKYLETNESGNIPKLME